VFANHGTVSQVALILHEGLHNGDNLIYDGLTRPLTVCIN